MSEFRCVHCNRIIEDLNKAYSRSGEHFCGKGCFDQDDYPNLVEGRKKRAKDDVKKYGKRKRSGWVMR